MKSLLRRLRSALCTPGITDNDLQFKTVVENRPSSLRWYPGAGLYRNVHVLSTGDAYVPVWGIQVTAPHVKGGTLTLPVK